MKKQDDPEQTMPSRVEVFLATMFSGEGYASADSGLLIASSTDGVRFQNIHARSEPVYAPASGVRDPIILHWQGQWYLVYSFGQFQLIFPGGHKIPGKITQENEKVSYESAFSEK